MLQFNIDNYDGVTHIIMVPNSIHILDLPMVLVSPHHWTQQTADTNISTSGRKSTIFQFQGYRKAVPYSIRLNTPSFRPTLVTLRYHTFAVCFKVENSPNVKKFRCSQDVVTDD